MTELESLIAERNRIQNRINELKERSLICGRAKLELDHFATSKPDEWCIYLQRIIDVPATAGRDMKRYSIIRAKTKKDAIGHIDEIIRDLQGLMERYYEEKGKE